MKKLILCDLETAENNYKYDCSNLGDDWGCAFGLIFLVLVSAIIWSVYGGIVWW